MRLSVAGGQLGLRFTTGAPVGPGRTVYVTLSLQAFAAGGT